MARRSDDGSGIPSKPDVPEEVGDERTLLVCCGAFHAKPGAFPNLTIQKIPKAVLDRCEWGRDDYSLRIASLPAAPDACGDDAPQAPEPTRKRSRRRGDPDTLSLLEPEPAE